MPTQNHNANDLRRRLETGRANPAGQTRRPPQPDRPAASGAASRPARPATGAAPAGVRQGSAPASARQGTPRPSQSPASASAPGRTDAPYRANYTEEYRRRQQAYNRQKEREAAMERRRQQEMLRKKEQRKRARQTFVSRAVVFLIILGILAAAAAAVFFLHFNKTDPEPQPSTVTYSYGGEEMDPLPEEEAIRGGVWYIDFHDVAGYLGMRIVGGADSMRYVITDSADAEGDGGEEDVVFFADSDAAEVNGQSIRLEGKAILEGDHYLVPCSFIETYMQGVRVTVSGGTVAVARTYTGDVQDALSFTLKDAGAIEPLPEDSEAVPGEIVTPPAEEDLTVTFQSDLSAYEEYMNPADRDGYLILVNNQNTVDESHKPDDLTDLVDTRKDGRNTQKMRLYAARALEAMFIELRASGYTDVSVTSAYRSYTYQNSLFNTYTSNEMAKNPSLTLAEAQAITATYSARPGTSEHQTGLCCDMHNLGAADVAFANKAAYAWLKENCWKFGFIIRFPEGKEEITGISFEPWHYRYVGRYHAKAIYDSGLCLEEYLASIQ